MARVPLLAGGCRSADDKAFACLAPGKSGGIYFWRMRFVVRVWAQRKFSVFGIFWKYLSWNYLHEFFLSRVRLHCVRIFFRSNSAIRDPAASGSHYGQPLCRSPRSVCFLCLRRKASARLGFGSYWRPYRGAGQLFGKLAAEHAFHAADAFDRYSPVAAAQSAFLSPRLPPSPP